MEINLFYGVCGAIIGALIGGLLTHRFALFRDRRAEYNSIVNPLRLKLLKAIERTSLNNIDFDEYRNLLSEKNRIKFDILLENKCAEYNKHFGTHDPIEGPKDMNVNGLKTAIRDIRNAIKPK